MLSLLSSTTSVSSIRRSGLLSWPTWRFFSQSHPRNAASQDPLAEQEKRDKRNERFRQRYNSDPELRERLLARRKDRYHSIPEVKTSAAAQHKAWLRAKLQKDPAYYEVKCEITRLANIRRTANDPRFVFLGLLYTWCKRHTWVREELPWKTHVPVYYSEKIAKQCAGCDRVQKGGGLRMWWEMRKDGKEADEEQCLCTACYVPRENWQDSLPQGYEDVRSFKELVARKKELDGVNPGRQTVKGAKRK